MPKGVYIRTKPAWNKGLWKEDYREERKLRKLRRKGWDNLLNDEKEWWKGSGHHWPPGTSYNPRCNCVNCTG